MVLPSTGRPHGVPMQGLPQRQGESAETRTEGLPGSPRGDRMAGTRKKVVVDESRLERALYYLAETDQMSAELKADVERKEYLCKLVRSRVFLTSTQGSNEAKRAEAESSEQVQLAEGAKCSAIVAYEKIKARRQTEALIVEVFRTMEASRRAGTI